jgi:hypothetical protein
MRMAIRKGEQLLQSLRDGRQLFIDLGGRNPTLAVAE